MIKVRKKQAILLAVVTLTIVSVYLLRTIPVRTFYYQTSAECNSNAFGGGNLENFQYRIIAGGLVKYNDKKSDLNSLNVPQSECKGTGVAPVDLTSLELYVL